MKRILCVVAIVAALWFANFLWAGNQGDLVELKDRGAYSSATGYLTVANNQYYLPGCWYDTTHEFDTLFDTVYTSWHYLGTGTMEYLIVQHQLSQFDTFFNVDSIDTAFLTLQACLDPVNQPTLTWSYAFATGIAANQAAVTTTVFTLSDSLSIYQYPHVRYMMTYRCVGDSNQFSWSADCAGKDLFTTHLPIILKEWYRPIWR